MILSRRDSRLERRESRLERNETRGGNLLLSGTVPSIFSWIRESPRKRKPPTERYTCEPVASASTASSSSRSNASSESVSKFEMENEMEVLLRLAVLLKLRLRTRMSFQKTNLVTWRKPLPAKTKVSQIWNRKSLT